MKVVCWKVIVKQPGLLDGLTFLKSNVANLQLASER